ncbi:hypothetical protein [Mesorhizobium sp. M0500]
MTEDENGPDAQLEVSGLWAVDVNALPDAVAALADPVAVSF